jgi:hypothetical protein
LDVGRVESYAQVFTPRNAILVASWVFLLAPALCGAGALEHHCDCAAAACSHESDCATDPCDQIVARRDDTPRLDLVTCMAVMAAIPEFSEAEPVLDLRLPHSGTCLAALHSRLIYESTLPRLN